MSDTMFKTGDTVMLKSGGAPMTVLVHVSGMIAQQDGWPEYVKCDLIDAQGNHRREKFHPDQLVHAAKHITFGEDGNIVHECWRPVNDPPSPFTPQGFAGEVLLTTDYTTQKSMGKSWLDGTEYPRVKANAS